VPVAFGPMSAFMETGYDEARTEYFPSLKDHVRDLLATCPDFMEILQSDLCVRFVPKKWTGIKGFPPLDLQVKEDFPPFHKGRSRPVNPRLYEHAKKEFERLADWLYVSALHLSLGVSVGHRFKGNKTVHTLLWGLTVAERLCV